MRGAVVLCSSFTAAGQQPPPAAPAGVIAPDQKLPPHIRKLTGFGERAEFSLDSTRVLFLSKTFGDAMEIDLATGVIRNLTAHFPHHGFTRALVWRMATSCCRARPSSTLPTSVRRVAIAGCSCSTPPPTPALSLWASKRRKVRCPPARGCTSPGRTGRRSFREATCRPDHLRCTKPTSCMRRAQPGRKGF